MSLKLANLSFEEAAAVPMAALTALQGLRHHGGIRPAQKVLINDASGGVGTFAVQIAKTYGAEVTGVTSTRNIDLVRSLGADHVVDYTTSDFARGARRYDLILDTVGNRSVPDLRRALAEGGKASVIGFTSVARLIGVSLRGGKDIAMVQAHLTTEDLQLLSELIEASTVRPAIDRRYPFNKIPAAIAYLEQGHAKGNVVVGAGVRDRPPAGGLAGQRVHHPRRTHTQKRTPSTPTVRQESIMTPHGRHTSAGATRSIQRREARRRSPPETR